ncbi:hypothetical protein PMI04_014950 [Sphingobium sp. AP49]|uniref:hypothetical protein n=1 Tax=Sphingobium sp. AP49 TaxID=1144307 RepID=UPI00026EE727|nr:hypothetical protein [Sphingobium sp. AP49]WHO37857.1 hypothetical protein PMI04_014950 [Sphingobium sp. AP49]
MITIIHGPMASGKTFHKRAFAQLYGATHIVDCWDAMQHEIPTEDNRLVLTYSHPDEIQRAIRLDAPTVQVRVVDIKTARHHIGVAPYAPGRTERATF